MLSTGKFQEPGRGFGGFGATITLANVVSATPRMDWRVTMKILIVDDEAEVAKLLATSVRQQGHEAIVAASGKEALTLVEQQNPDAVFLDIVMPEMSGIEVLRRIRETYHGLPVIVISGRASRKEIDEATHLGITDYIEKPFLLNTLDQIFQNLRPRM
jgi:DNA-binding response OmpR family regulator